MIVIFLQIPGGVISTARILASPPKSVIGAKPVPDPIDAAAQHLRLGWYIRWNTSQELFLYR
jgi:hypothetical protein